MDKKEALAAAEIVINEKNEVLWVERYVFSRIHDPGQLFIRDYKEYKVVASAATPGDLGGVLVEHKVKLIADRTPIKATPPLI